MNQLDFLLKGAFLLLGIISIVIGKLLSDEFILYAGKNYLITDQKKYVRLYREMFYCLGGYYLILGAILLLLKTWPEATYLYATVIPFLIVVFFIRSIEKNRKKIR